MTTEKTAHDACTCHFPTLDTLAALRHEIAERVAQSRAHRETIRTTKGAERAKAWQDKRSLAWATRHRLLALAYLRGVALACVERPPTGEPSERWRTREQPHAGAIADFAGYGDRTDGVIAVRRWLEGGASDGHALLSAERERRWTETKAARAVATETAPIAECA